MNGLPRLIGVEEELLLVDPETGRALPVADRVVDAARQRSPAAPVRGPSSAAAPRATELVHEAKLEQIEVISPPFESLDEVARAIVEGRAMADHAAQTQGARAAALATSVVAGSTHLTEQPRYEHISELFGLTMEEQLTCGMHIHVSVLDKHEGVAVLDRMRPWLHVLLALSANSPMWAGVDTGYASYRYQAWMRWPSAGSYDRFGSAEEYRHLMRALVTSGVILDPGMVYFDARLSAHQPTVELRAPDVCLEPEAAVALAGLSRALVETESANWRAGAPVDPYPTSLMRLAMWSASRYGLGANLWDPNSRGPRKARLVVEALLRHVGPALRDFGDDARVRTAIARIFEEGTGADVQRRTMQHTASEVAVVREAIRRSAGAERG